MSRSTSPIREHRPRTRTDGRHRRGRLRGRQREIRAAGGNRTGANRRLGLRPRAGRQAMGQVNLALAARNHLRDGGSITLIAGVLSDQPIATGSSASMVNGAIEAFVRAAAIELPRGLRINRGEPGRLHRVDGKVRRLLSRFRACAGRARRAGVQSQRGGIADRAGLSRGVKGRARGRIIYIRRKIADVLAGRDPAALS